MWGTLAKYISKEATRRLAARSRTTTWLLWALALTPILVVLAAISLVLLFVAVEAGALGNNCGSSVPPVGAAGNVRTEAAFVQYLESQGISPNGAAGIVGNLEQESGLNAKTPGGGLAQWLGNRWSAMVAWTTKQNLDPNSNAGQLTYIVYDLRANYAQLLAELNGAPDPGIAATMFESVYEVCSGVSGYLKVAPGSACNDPARRAFAVSALKASGGDNAVPVSLDPAGSCMAVGGAGGDPIPGFTPGRDDMGVDACSRPGQPILAPAQSTLADYVPSWYNGQPLLLFVFSPSLAGTYRGDQYWFVAEQIVPASTQIGTQFGPGQPVATYAASGTCIEIGWGDPNTNSRTLVPGDANPAPGALTPEAEAFKVYFHIPWVGQSP